MKREDCYVGLKVFFGRRKGEKTPGEVIRVNPKSAKVKQLGTRGSSRTYSDGTVWTVPYSLLIEADSSSPPPSSGIGVSVPSAQAYQHFFRGDYVTFEARGKTIHGQVDRVNKKTITVIQIDCPTTKWRVSPGFLTKISGRQL